MGNHACHDTCTKQYYWVYRLAGACCGHLKVRESCQPRSSVAQPMES